MGKNALKMHVSSMERSTSCIEDAGTTVWLLEGSRAWLHRIDAFEMHACNQAAVSVGIIFLLQLLIELAIS